MMLKQTKSVQLSQKETFHYKTNGRNYQSSIEFLGKHVNMIAMEKRHAL